MIKFSIEEKFGVKIGVIEMKGVGALANAFRRVLLDEIETTRFNMDEVEFAKTDPFLTHQTLINVSLIHLYEEGEFYIDVANNSSAPIDVLSDNIKTIDHKPAKVEKNVFICTLQPRCKVKITKLSSHRGIGRTHAKFSPIFGQVEYIPTDVAYVHYLNDRGFVENNRKCIKRFKDYDEKKQYIIWNKNGEKNISEKDKEYIKNFVKIPAGEYTFLRAEIDRSEDFIVKFRSHDPKLHFEEAVDVIMRGLDEENYTVTIGELIRSYVYREMECVIFSEWRVINDNSYKIEIDDQNATKLLANAIAAIKKILKNIKK